MKMRELADQIGAKIYLDSEISDPEVTHLVAADTASGLIAGASPVTLLVTGLANLQLIRIAELMDAPGLCLAGAIEPGPGLLDSARASGLTMMTSPHGLEKTRRLLEGCLRGAGAARR
ncbi:MAG TPA: hypothetical protein VMQ10_03190 [Spirochaetia bacterium]|nr:hypothetical protein [Spirochaetia bacterium]